MVLRTITLNRRVVLYLENFQDETSTKITRLDLVHTQGQSWNYQRRFLSTWNNYYDNFRIRPSTVMGRL
jgi:hypothetical protein